MPISDMLRSDGGYDQTGARSVMSSGVKVATIGAITAETVNTDSESGVLLFLGSAEGVRQCRQCRRLHVGCCN